MITRAEVESLLATMTEIHPENQGVIAELCRTWLAVDAAPAGDVISFESSVWKVAKEDVRRCTSLRGTRIKLVAAPPEPAP